MSVNVGKAVGYLDLDISGFLTGLKTANSEATKEANNLATRMSKGFKTVGSKLTSVGKTLTAGVTVPLVAVGTLAVKAGIEFESAFAGVRKTVDATEGEFEALSAGIKEMSKVMPQSASEIAGVAEAAGQLGIETKNILGFTKTMVMLGDATNMSSDEAATALARLANITQMPQTEFDKLGSVVVELGNNLATTEREIVDMGLNLAAAGSQVGMTEAQILGFAGALSSVGIEAAAGGTAFSKVMVDMQLATELGGEKLNKFASIAGMTADQFKVKFKEDAAGALVEFIKGLQNTEEKGMSAIAVLDDMGIAEVRMRDALLRAAGAGDLFTDSIDLATNAWGKNVALQKEAEQRYQTTASQLSMLKNKFSLIGITLAKTLIPIIMKLADSLGKVIDWFASLNPKTQESIVKFGVFAAAIGPVLLVLGKLFTGIGAITGVIGAAGVASAAATPAVGALAVAFNVLLGPVGLIIAAVAALVVGIIALVNHLKKDSIPAVELFGDGVSEATEKAVGGFLELNEEATLSLKELSWSAQTVTKEMADNIVGNFSQMSKQILAELDEYHTESLSKMQTFLANSENLSKEEQETILNNMTEGHEKQRQAVIDGEARIKEIMDLASAEKRALTKSEQSEINEIQTVMVETGIKVLSDSEVESKLIMERMKDQAGEMSALQAAEVVKNSLEQKEGAVKAAEEQYDEVMREIIRQRDEAGTISEEQAQKLIDEAKRQKDEAVNSAEEMHNNVITEAKAQASEHVNAVDWTTGEIKSKWEVLKDSTTNTWKNIGTAISKFITSIINYFAELPTNIANFITQAWNSVVQWATNMVNKAREMGTNFLNAVVEFFTDLPYKVGYFIGNALANVKKWATNMATQAKEMGKNFINNVVSFFTQLPGKVKGFINSAFENVKTWATNMANKAKEMGTNFINNVVNFFKQLPGKIKEQLDKAITRVVTWVSNMGRKGKEAATSLINGVIEGAKKIPSQMASIGRDIVNGVWSGIKKAKDTFVKNVKGFFNGIVDGVKSGLGIGSPSKVFADEIGRWLPPGVVSGFTKSMPAATKKIQTILSNTVKSLGKETDNIDASFGVEGFESKLKGLYTNVALWFESIDERIGNSINNMKEDLRSLIQLGSLVISNDGTLGYVGYGGFNKTPTSKGKPNSGDPVPISSEGDTFNFYSPKPIDEIEAANQLKKTKRDLSEGF